jgi:serine/threonine-protein kinase
MPLHDGLIFRLARSGPNLQVHLSAVKSLAAAIKSSPALVSRMPLPIDDDMPQTLGLLGENPILQESAIESVVAASSASKKTLSNPTLAKTTTSADRPGETGGHGAEQLFSTKTGQPLRVLQTLGDYQVLKILGQGETAVTSLAWRQGQTVVLKCLNAQLAKEPAAIAQFQQLAVQLQLATEPATIVQVQQLAAQLQQLDHRGFSRVLDVIEVDGITYLVMEMIYGQTLSQYVAQSGPMPPRAALAVIRALCETLKFLHRRRIVHGHITPDHVMQRSLSPSEQSILLTDFGAMRLWHWQRSGGFNPMSYLAPEQSTGATTPAVDLYALGTTLVFLLTGQPPQHFYQPLADGMRFAPPVIPGVAPQVFNFISHLTRPNPAERPNSVGDVLAVLQQIACS